MSVYDRLTKQQSFKTLTLVPPPKENENVDLTPFKNLSKKMVESMLQKEKSVLEE